MKHTTIPDLLDKYIIVVQGDEKRIVYALDDEAPFSIHNRSYSRSNFSHMSRRTFKTFEEAQAGLKYMEGCFRCKFVAITVAELREISPEGFKLLCQDFNGCDYDGHVRRMEHEKLLKDIDAAQKAKNKKAFELLSKCDVFSIEASSDDGFYDITVKLKK